MKKSFLLLLLLLSIHIYSEDKEIPKEDIKSLKEERTETIKYGIDSEVISLINDIRTEKDPDYNDLFLDILINSKNIELKKTIFDLFNDLEFNKASEYSIEIIDNYEENNQDLVISALQYLDKIKNREALDSVKNLVDIENDKIARQAITVIGNSENIQLEDDLLKFLEDDDFKNELKPELILALGNLKSVKSIDKLAEILENDDEESSWRNASCRALGKIGNDSVVPVLIKAYEGGDTILRTFAIGSLSNFSENEKAMDTVLESLRDTNWRIRTAAADSLGKSKYNKAIDILKYKAEKDPVINVKLEAIKALGQFGTNDSFKFIVKISENDKANLKERFTALDVLIDNDFDNSLKGIKELLVKEWDKKENSQILEFICRKLSYKESTKLDDLYKKMLTHKSVTIQSCGINGIKVNKLSGLKENLEKMTEEGNSPVIRKRAKAVLEDL